MGEIIEITTIAKQQYIFYKITSGSLRFQVRGLGDPAISLVKRPCRSCKLWIVISHEGNTAILKNGKQVYSVPTPTKLSDHFYRDFWISWHNNVIALGQGDSDEPFAQYKDDTFGLNYITFATRSGLYVGSVKWRFEIPPLLETGEIKAMSSGTPEWKAVVNQLPDGAFIGGYEMEPVYIMRAEHRGSLVPGKFLPRQGIGYIPWEGNMLQKNFFEVLCGYNCIWVPCSNGKIPAGAVRGGYSGNNREPFFIGRVLYNNHLVLGRIQPSHNVCYIPYDDKEMGSKVYEILIVPDENMHCASPFLMDDIRLYETAPVDIYFEDSEDIGD